MKFSDVSEHNSHVTHKHSIPFQPLSSSSSTRWLPLFSAIFFFLLIFTPLQYDAPEAAPEAGAKQTEQEAGGLQVKLPRFQPFGLAVLVKHTFPDTIGARMSNLVGEYRGDSMDIPVSAAHLIFVTFVISHILTIMLGKTLFHMKDTHTTFFSTAYFNLLFGSVFAAILLGLDAWSLFEAAMRHEEFFMWLSTNTNIQDPEYATLWFTSAVVIITLLVAVWREQQCVTVIQKLYYFAESLIILEIIFNSFTNIDVLLFLLSHPFPQFLPDFNPFFSPRTLEIPEPLPQTWLLRWLA